jgi:beta-lactamase regulating signal transducer with metallopeptidase domain
MRVISFKNKKTQNKNTTILNRRISPIVKREKKASFSGSARISLVSLVFVILGFIAISGVFYLYQVNDMATKGAEIKKAENEIKMLEESKEKLKIKEVELRSMYNLEKEVKDLDLVNTAEISYIEVKGPMAMK